MFKAADTLAHAVEMLLDCHSNPCQTSYCELCLDTVARAFKQYIDKRALLIHPRTCNKGQSVECL